MGLTDQLPVPRIRNREPVRQRSRSERKLFWGWQALVNSTSNISLQDSAQVAGPVAASASGAGSEGTSSSGFYCSVGVALVPGALIYGCGVFTCSCPFPGLFGGPAVSAGAAWYPFSRFPFSVTPLAGSGAQLLCVMK